MSVPAKTEGGGELTAEQKFELAERILRLCRFERFTYLVVSLITAAVVVVVGFRWLSTKDADKTVAGFMFGSAGIVTFSISRLLAIFNKVFKAVLG